MADNSSLTASSNGGSQTSTASPQTSSSGGGFTPVTQNVQPGTGTSLLEGQGSISLNPNVALTTVALPGTSTATTGATAPVQHHNVNPIMIGFVGVLIFIAIAMVLHINSSAKNTTD